MTLSLALSGCGGGSSSQSTGTTGEVETDSRSQSEGADEVLSVGVDGSGDPSGGGPGGEDPGASTSDGADVTGADLDAGTSSGAPADDTGATGTEPPEGALFHEPFDAPDGASWADPWIDVGGLLASEVMGGRGRLQGQQMTVGRMVFPGIDALDVDATATVIFDDFSSQGFGFYVRQNGGYLVSTDPPGQGYALYVEGGYMQLLGVWRERNGVEEIITGEVVEGGELESGVEHRVRFRCTQEGNQTRLQAKVWPADEVEPDAWAVDVHDGTAELQGVSGTLAVDIYNYQGTGSILLDDITLMPAS